MITHNQINQASSDWHNNSFLAN